MQPTDAPPILSEAVFPDHVADAALRDQAWLEGPAAGLRYHLDDYWIDDRTLYLRGFLFVPHQRTLSLAGIDGAARVPATLLPRPDLARFYPDCAEPERAGFRVMMPFRPGLPIALDLQTEAGTSRIRLALAGRSRVSSTWRTGGPFAAWIATADRPGTRMLEIGSRLVGEASRRHAAQFRHLASYTGIDIHPGPGVDVVCDAHALSRTFRPASFDAAFSLSVLEHVAEPWRIARELNRVLSPGGLLMHSVPFAYPVHEAPADYWRFTHHGLALLFGPANGFEVLASGLACEARIVPEWRDILPEMPLIPAFAEAWIHARKVAELPEDDAAPPTGIAYPRHDKPTPAAPGWQGRKRGLQT